MNQSERTAYLKSQVVANLLINSVLNGIIAVLFYRSRDAIPSAEIAVDIQITVGIIAFFVSWIGISAVRKKWVTSDQELAIHGARRLSFPLPRNAVLRAMVITAVMMLVFGGFVLTGPLTFFNVLEVSNWGYILFKTIYTGLCAACAAALALLSVFREAQPTRESI